MSDQPDFKVGDVVNGHVLTTNEHGAYEWVPVQPQPRPIVLRPRNHWVRRNAKWVYIGVLVGALGVGAALTSQKKDTATNTPSATSSSSGYLVSYTVGGYATSVDVTYQSLNGSEQANGAPTPWQSSVYQMQKGDFVYVSAQNDDDSGSVTCEIQVDGHIAVTHTSTGAYAVATCSGRL
jgi:hypothetical protein